MLQRNSTTRSTIECIRLGAVAKWSSLLALVTHVVGHRRVVATPLGPYMQDIHPPQRHDRRPAQDKDRSSTVVFRKESRHESFQRQISALRQQLSADQDGEFADAGDAPQPIQMAPPPMAGWDDARAARESMPMDSPHMTASDASTSVIASNAQWNGTLRSQGSLHVFGQVEGELIAEDEIYVAEGAIIRARVAASTVVVAGTVSGTIECTQRLEVLDSGHVSGDVTSPTLVVHEGATVEGDLTMRVPEPVAS
jgi:cytoskeletal protein CcmA (bactofilin family)